MNASKKKKTLTMRAKTNTITINGRTYDTITGKPVDGVKKHVVRNAETVVTPTKPVDLPPKPKKISISVSDSPKPIKLKASTASVHVVGRHPERSTTLMRHAVKKPIKVHKKLIVSGLTTQPKSVIVQGGSAHTKEHGANQYSRSSHISKFANGSPITKRTAHIPVTQPPVKVLATSRHDYDIDNIPPAPHVSKPATLREQHRDLFETAIEQSTSHSAKKHTVHKRGRKAARLALGAASLTLLVAFFAYQSVPNMALKRASSTIGFTASVPSYRPSGFRENGPVQYSSGKVTIDFRSNSDSRAYTVTQATAYTNDYTLRSDYLNNRPFEPVSMLGQTGYFYGNANLTWVRNGIWYNIQGDSQLSRDQLIHVASSLF